MNQDFLEEWLFLSLELEICKMSLDLPITALIFVCITDYYFKKKKRERDPIFLSKLHIYIDFMIFVTFFSFNIVFFKIQPLL